MGNISLIYFGLTDFELGKDPILVPSEIAYALGIEANILCENKCTSESIIDGKIKNVNIRHVNMHGKIVGFLQQIFYIITNARKIDILMGFHFRKYFLLNAYLYKKINPNGKIYIKLDGDTFKGTKKWNHGVMKIVYESILNNACVFSYETPKIYESICKSPFFEKVKNKLVYVPNGIDTKLVKQLNIQIKPFEDKENTIITVARLGTYQKNTQLILQSLDGLDLNGWKVILIGSIEDSFNENINKFFYDNPSKIDSVKFIGPVVDKKELWEYYNSSKVFLFPSRFESFGLALLEAKFFNNYLISTDVGIASEIIKDEKDGVIISNDNMEELKNAITDVVTGKIDLRKDYCFNNYLSYENSIKPILPFLL